MKPLSLLPVCIRGWITRGLRVVMPEYSSEGSSRPDETAM
jgi:hypothetical protein